MPDKSWPIRFIRDNIGRFVQQTSALSKTALAAAGLLTLASLLTVTVIFGLNNHKQKIIVSQSDRPTADTMTILQTAVTAIPKQQIARSSVNPPSQATIVPEPATQPVVPQKPIVYKPENARTPLQGGTILVFGWYENQLYKDWRYHTGIDLGSPQGTPATAIWGGEVVTVYNDNITGLTVAVKTGEYTVMYGTLAKSLVTQGETVAPGAKIGLVGSSKAEPYDHLHLAIKKDEKFINPQLILH